MADTVIPSDSLVPSTSVTDMPSATSVISSAHAKLMEHAVFKSLLKHFQERLRDDPKFKWALIGGSIYFTARLLKFDVFTVGPISNLVDYCYEKLWTPESIIFWMGSVDPDVPFGRVGHTRCLESDMDTMAKYGIPMNSEKCIRAGMQFIPGEFYQQFDLNEYDQKNTPLAWNYGPISDPTLIMPTGWYNDMSGENQEYQLFRRYMRIYGYLPPTAYKELYKYCKIILLQRGQHLFKIGDSDDKVYIVITGAVDVFSSGVGPHGDYVHLKTTQKGCHIVSIFSMMASLTGYSMIIKTVFAKAKLDITKVLVFPMSAIKDYLTRNQEFLVPCMIRLLERSYRFQYQILHKALQLSTMASHLDRVPWFENPSEGVDIPEASLSAKLTEDALRSFMKFLDMDDFDFIREHCKVDIEEPTPVTTDLNEIRAYHLNSPDAAYKYIYSGKLEFYFLKSNLNQMDKRARRKYFEEKTIAEPLYYGLAGEGAGSLTGILGFSRVLFCRPVERTVVVTLSRESLERLMQKHPLSIYPIAFMAVYRLSPFARALDFAMDWTNAKEGQYIFEKEQMCHDSFLLLTGRARAYKLDSESSDGRAIVDYKENDWIGLTESLLQSKRHGRTCVCIREADFVMIPNDLLRSIVMNYSNAAQIMLDFLVYRSLKSKMLYESGTVNNPEKARETHKETRRTHSIALVPAVENIPYSVLAVEIKRHYETWGSCLILTYEKALEDLQMEEITARDQFKVEMYTLTQMSSFDLVIFICIPKIHHWNEICGTYSEIMFTVGTSVLPNVPVTPSEYEELAVGKRISSRRKEIILLHCMDTVLPQNTKEWLCRRDWLHFHHHIRLPNDAFCHLGAIPEAQVAADYKSLHRDIELHSDLSRFLRWILGKTFGVLFSSGGARIGSQLGMLQALHEYKMIPIDMACGTGAGFLLAAIHSIYQDYTTVQKIVENLFDNFCNDLRAFHWDDITFPWISLTKGKRVLTYVYQLFGSVQIEDTWIPLCCVTTNLTSQDVRIDRSGPLWVYVRASLSHVNSSPPICAPLDGEYICDGAHANSLPEDIIKEFGAEYIIAFTTVGGKVNIETKADPNMNVFRFVTKTLWSVLDHISLTNPTFERVFNSLAVTQTRMYAAGVEAVSSLKYVVYVRPPVEHIPSQGWSDLPSLHRIGYFYMKSILDKNPYDESIPFQVYWRNIKKTSTDLASEGGRDLQKQMFS